LSGARAWGIGVSKPLVSLLSSGKVELGLLPLGAVGMILVVVAAGTVRPDEQHEC
jgi:hypothetical protein